jgi:hypothetical protein
VWGPVDASWLQVGKNEGSSVFRCSFLVSFQSSATQYWEWVGCRTHDSHQHSQVDVIVEAACELFAGSYHGEDACYFHATSISACCLSANCVPGAKRLWVGLLPRWMIDTMRIPAPVRGMIIPGKPCGR